MVTVFKVVTLFLEKKKFKNTKFNFFQHKTEFI